jgi:hypothetical protein
LVRQKAAHSMMSCCSAHDAEAPLSTASAAASQEASAVRILAQAERSNIYQGKFCQLYDRKTPIAAADLLNDPVLPFFEEVRCQATACAD